MNNTYKGQFTPTNPGKYVGKHPITFRSRWELKCMERFDKHPSVVAWSSESVSIPYQNPFTGKWTFYIPDFLVIYQDKNGNKKKTMLEIKPLKETPGYQPISERTGKPLKIKPITVHVQAINAAKWKAAVIYCTQRGIDFQVITESSLFKYDRRK